MLVCFPVDFAQYLILALFFQDLDHEPYMDFHIAVLQCDGSIRNDSYIALMDILHQLRMARDTYDEMVLPLMHNDQATHTYSTQNRERKIDYELYETFEIGINNCLFSKCL